MGNAEVSRRGLEERSEIGAVVCVAWSSKGGRNDFRLDAASDVRLDPLAIFAFEDMLMFVPTSPAMRGKIPIASMANVDSTDLSGRALLTINSSRTGVRLGSSRYLKVLASEGGFLRCPLDWASAMSAITSRQETPA